MKSTLVLFLFALTSCFVSSQDVIIMEKSGGVYLIPCNVNGLPLKFIFDTGASDVSISLTEAMFMLKNRYLKESDIKGKVYYSIANGEIAEGTKIYIQRIEVGKQTLYNVEASIVHSTEAPLLFGQSAMERFGNFTMDYSNSNLIIGGSSNTSVSNITKSSVIKSVKIGTQTWMSENLNVDRFRNGDIIPEAKTMNDWDYCAFNQLPAWCYYENDSEDGKKYGKLYNWFAVNDSRGLAPMGWHIPDTNELKKLKIFLGRKSSFKLQSKSGWNLQFATDIMGFNAKPSGYRVSNSLFGFQPNSQNKNNGFYHKGEVAYYWTKTSYNESPYKRAYPWMIFNGGEEFSYNYYRGFYKGSGMAIRCIKD